MPPSVEPPHQVRRGDHDPTQLGFRPTKPRVMPRAGCSRVQAVRVTTTAPTRSSAPRAQPIEVAAAGYFALQAVLGVMLWVGVGTSDVVRSWLELVPDRPQVTNVFLPADIVVIAASALAAWALWRGRPWAMLPVLFTVGGVVYPTVYLIGWVTTTDGTGEVALRIMLVTSALSCGAALLVGQARRRA